MVEAAKRPPINTGRVERNASLYSHEYDRAFLFQTAVADLGQVALRTAPLESLFRTVSTRVASLLQADLVAVLEVEDDCRLKLAGGAGWSADCIGSVVAEWNPEGVPSYPSVLQGPIFDGFLGVPPQLDGIAPPETTGIATVQTVPIGWNNAPVGALAVLSYTGRPFAPDETTFLRSIAHILASAIDRSRIEQTARGEAEERKILAEISRIIGSSLEINEVYSLFANQVRRLINFDRITINIIDAVAGTYSSAYVAGVPVPGWKKGVPQPIAGKGVEAVIRSGAAIIVQGDQIAEFIQQYPRTQIGRCCGLYSLLNVPVFWQGEVIGVLALRSKSENAYSRKDLHVAERIAFQIAGSLANSDLHARQKEYVRQQATLAEISRVVASSVRIDEIYPKFASAVGKLIPFDRISICTVDEENGTAMARYVWGATFKGSQVMVSRPFNGSATGAVAEARAGMIVTREMVEEQPERFSFVKIGVAAGLKSMLAVPLMHRGRAIGSLILRSWQEDIYSSRDLALAEQVAVQISGVVWSAHLNEQLEKSVREQAVLAELGMGIIEARDVPAVFSKLHSALAQCIEFDRIAVGICDPDSSTLRFEFVRGVDVPGLGQGTEMARPSATAPGVTWADAMGTHYGANAREGFDGPEKADAISAAGLRSWVQAPLRSRDRHIGFVSLRSKREDAYSASDLHLLERAAAQVAPGLDNVRYYLRVEKGNRLDESSLLPSAILVDSKAACRSELRVSAQAIGMPVIAESDSIDGAGSLIPSTGACIVLWELHADDKPDLSILTSLRTTHAQLKVVVIDSGSVAEVLGEAIRYGVNGFLARDTNSAKLSGSLRRVVAGETVIDPRILRSYFARPDGRSGTPHHVTTGALSNLAERDVAILHAVAKGCSNAEIAADLNFAVGTIKNRLARIYRVLGVSDRAGAMALAIRAGLGS